MDPWATKEINRQLIMLLFSKPNDLGKGKALIPKGNQIAIRSVKMAVWLFKGFAGFE
ncbi:hypothetical protein D3C73_1629210 [compost metagenome]